MNPRRTAVVILAVTAFLSFALTFPAKAQSQGEMNAQAEADFEKADKELNLVHQKVLKSADDDLARQKLAAAQKAWIKFRDAQAEFDADAGRGGTIAPCLYAASKTDTTEQRIAVLKRELTDPQGK